METELRRKIRENVIIQRMEAEYREIAQLTEDPVGFALTYTGQLMLSKLASQRLMIAVRIKDEEGKVPGCEPN